MTIIRHKVSRIKTSPNKLRVTNTTRNLVSNNPNKIIRMWENDVVHIIGGGPSLKNANWNMFKGKKVIAVNRAYEVLPDAEVLYWTDRRFYEWYKTEIDKFKGLKYTCRYSDKMTDDIIVLNSTTNFNKFNDKSYIEYGNNSGYGAIMLAVKMGATKIYLHGFDMQSKPDETHWHSGYQTKHNHTIYDKLKKKFDELAKFLRTKNIQIYNANTSSGLTSFPKCTFNQAIGGYIQ